jgi:hypothetical protein
MNKVIWMITSDKVKMMLRNIEAEKTISKGERHVLIYLVKMHRSMKDMAQMGITVLHGLDVI